MCLSAGEWIKSLHNGEEQGAFLARAGDLVERSWAL